MYIDYIYQSYISKSNAADDPDCKFRGLFLFQVNILDKEVETTEKLTENKQ